MIRFIVSLLLSAALASAAAAQDRSLPAIDHVYERGERSPHFARFADFFGLPREARQLAVVVGVGSFADPQFDPLPGAQRDALRVYDYLRDEAEFDKIWLLTNENATLQRIREVILDELQPNVGTNDRVMFYFTGHGVSEEFGSSMRGFLPVSQSDRGRLSSMVSMREVGTWADALQEAHQLLFVLDSCVSGLAGDVMMQEINPEVVRDLGRPGHHLITAGTGEQNAYATADGSYFTRVFLDGIRGAADAAFSVREPDGAISVSELTLYVRQRLRTDLADRDYLMTPQRTILNDRREGEFFFARLDDVAETPLLGGEVAQGDSGSSDPWLVDATLELSPGDAVGPVLISPRADYLVATVRDAAGAYRGVIWDAESGLAEADFDNVFPSLLEYRLIDEEFGFGFFSMSSRELRWWEWTPGFANASNRGRLDFGDQFAARTAIFDPLRRSFYVGHDLRTLSVWDYRGEYIGNITGDNTASVHGLHSDAGNQRILVEQAFWVYLLETADWRPADDADEDDGYPAIQDIASSFYIYERLADYSEEAGLIATELEERVVSEDGEAIYNITSLSIYTLDELASFTYDPGAEPVVQITASAAPFAQARFSFDATVIYGLDEAGDLFGWNVTSGEEVFRSAGLIDEPVERFDVVPNGGGLLLTHRNGQLTHLQPENGAVFRFPGRNTQAAIAPDGSFLVAFRVGQDRASIWRRIVSP